jgi:pimeloyl-ACP methyl ester carboxylesterase
VSAFALIHGAGDGGWFWHRVEVALRARGHDVVAPDLPADDESADLHTYADVVVQTIGDRAAVVVVAQSFGAFTAPLVCDRTPAELLVLVAGMIPAPGEPPDDWWANTGYESTDESGDDVMATYYHDVSPELAAEALRRERAHPSARAGREPWPLRAWPAVPTRVLLCRDDRLFAPSFLRRVSEERLGITPDEIDGGHCVALSRPTEVADRLESYLPAA